MSPFSGEGNSGGMVSWGVRASGCTPPGPPRDPLEPVAPSTWGASDGHELHAQVEKRRERFETSIIWVTVKTLPRA